MRIPILVAVNQVYILYRVKHVKNYTTDNRRNSTFVRGYILHDA